MKEDNGAARRPAIRPQARTEPLWLQGLTILAMTASVVAQSFLIGQLLEYAAIPRSDQRGWFGMGLMVMLAAALIPVVPGTVAAVYRLALALRRQRDVGRAQASIAINAAVMVMPVAVFLVMLYADTPRGPAANRASSAPSAPLTPPAAAAAVPRDESADGVSWANKHGVDDPEACSTGSASFREGCRFYARECRILPCVYQAPSGATVTIFSRPSRVEPIRPP